MISSFLPDENKGFYENFVCTAWTIGGKEMICRSLIQFDLSKIPIDAIVLKANLNLYASIVTTNSKHSTSGGSNEAILQKILEPWDESTVTWNNQPKTTETGQVLLLESIKLLEHYTDIDVRDMVQDMVSFPESNHGWMFRLVNEQYYRSMCFVSSDFGKKELRPELEVVFITRNTLLGNDTVLCMEDSLILGSEGEEGTYKWQDDSEGVFIVKSPGIYAAELETCHGILRDTIKVEYDGYSGYEKIEY